MLEEGSSNLYIPHSKLHQVQMRCLSRLFFSASASNRIASILSSSILPPAASHSPHLSFSAFSPRLLAALPASSRSHFSSIAAAAPPAKSVPEVPISESTQPESKLELDSFGEPRVMAWLPKVKTSPRKLNLVAKLVRRMGLEQALMQLRFCSKKMADVVSKTIHDAKWNAVNNNVRATATACPFLQPRILTRRPPLAGLGRKPPVHRRGYCRQEQVRGAKYRRRFAVYFCARRCAPC
jgi:hypothetical protein